MADETLPKPAYELANEHRPYFGLKPVEPSWQVRVKPSKLHSNLKIYWHDGRIRKYIRFYENATQVHYEEVDVDLCTDDEAQTWWCSDGRSKPKKVQQSNLPTDGGCRVFWNGYPGVGVALLECVHSPSERVVVASGEIPFSDSADVEKWVGRFVQRAGGEHLERLARLEGESKRPPDPWRPGDFVAIEVAHGSWLFARLLVPVDYLSELGILPGFSDEGRPAHAWRCVAAPLWWSEILCLPTSEPSPTLETLLEADRLAGGFLSQPYHHDGRHRIIGRAPVQAEELDFPESLQRETHFGDTVYCYDWGLAHLEIPKGTAIALSTAWRRFFGQIATTSNHDPHAWGARGRRFNFSRSD